MATENSGTLALLIDGDNVSPTIIVGLMAEIANYGGGQCQTNLWREDARTTVLGACNLIG